jgi:anti-anti-sigma factor
MTIFSLDVSDQGQCDLRVVGEIVVDVASQLSTMGLLSLTNTEAVNLVIDLSGVTLMDSAGVGALTTIRDAADASDKSVRLRNVPEPIQLLLAGAGLDGDFTADSVGATAVPSTHVRRTA